MGTQNPQGLKQYFFPLAAGYWRYYNSAEQSFWCCTGTGAEEFAKFTIPIYFHDRREKVWVNQFIASELDWKEAGFGLRQETSFPAEQGTTLQRQGRPPRSSALSTSAFQHGLRRAAPSASMAANWKPSPNPAAISRSPASGTTATRSRSRSL